MKNSINDDRSKDSSTIKDKELKVDIWNMEKERHICERHASTQTQLGVGY